MSNLGANTIPTPTEDVSIITISTNLSKAVKNPVKITSSTKIVPLKITMPGPVPYISDKSIPWNYGGEIYYHGVKQVEQTAEEESSEEDNSDISNIVGTSKVTRSGRIFSPEIAPLTVVFGPVAIPKITHVIVPTNVPADKNNTIPIHAFADEIGRASCRERV